MRGKKKQYSFGMWNNFEKGGQWIVSPLKCVHSNLKKKKQTTLENSVWIDGNYTEFVNWGNNGSSCYWSELLSVWFEVFQMLKFVCTKFWFVNSLCLNPLLNYLSSEVFNIINFMSAIL